MSGSYSRRSFIGGALVAGAAAGVAGGKPFRDEFPIAGDVVPFHGEHQSGITKPSLVPEQQGIFAAYDVTAENYADSPICSEPKSAAFRG